MKRQIYTTKSDFVLQNNALKTNLPYTDDLSVLGEKLTIKNKTINNRLVCQPMEGCDGKPDGSPDELTIRRYMRFAKGGAGLIWFEATSCREDGRANPRQLWIKESNLDNFKRIVDNIKETAIQENGYEPVIIMQATHSGRYSKPNGKPEPLIAYNNPIFEGENPIDKSRLLSDDALDKIKEDLISSALLAEKAGFDGVDIKCCHRYLNSELLSAYTRDGKYGGSLENRTRFLRDAIKGATDLCSTDFIITSRLNVYDGFPFPYGFGVSKDTGTQFDKTEPVWLLKELSKLGVELLNITMGNPYFNPHVNRPYATGGYDIDEHPLEGVSRMLNGISSLKTEVPELKIVSSGLSYLGAIAPNVVSAYIKDNKFDLAGFGRIIFAYPDFAKDILSKGTMEVNKLCLCCSKCTELMRGGTTPGCVVRDSLYTQLYQNFKKR